jgi:hypothetical protein
MHPVVLTCVSLLFFLYLHNNNELLNVLTMLKNRYIINSCYIVIYEFT